MPIYKFRLIFPDGEILDDEDDRFDTEYEARDAALYSISCFRQCAEILHLSNPSDYDYDEDEYEDPTFEIIEIDDDGTECIYAELIDTLFNSKE